MVPEGSHVRSVYLTPSSDVLSSNLISKLLIDCSTIDTAASLSIRSQSSSTTSPLPFTITRLRQQFGSPARHPHIHSRLLLQQPTISPTSRPPWDDGFLNLHLRRSIPRSNRQVLQHPLLRSYRHCDIRSHKHWDAVQHRAAYPGKRIPH